MSNTPLRYNPDLYTSCLDYDIFSAPLPMLSFNRKMVISTINQYSYCIAEHDLLFRKALQMADVLLPDGIGIVSSVKLIARRNIQKIAGADVHLHLLHELSKTGGKCFYLGSSDETLQLIKARMDREFPTIEVSYYAPPFKENFSDEDNERMITAVNDFKPDVLFLGMTAPKQEKWAYQFKTQLDCQTICCVGAVFDFYAGTKSRPGLLWQRFKLEWLGRLLREPQRLWRRYLYYGPLFIIMVFKEKLLTIKKHRKLEISKL